MSEVTGAATPSAPAVGKASTGAMPAAEPIRGELRGIGLGSFLQLLELERKSCTVEVEDDARTGCFVFEVGTLVHARQEALLGESAAIEMLCWSEPHIRVRAEAGAPRNVVTRLSQLLLEAYRMIDERALWNLGTAPPGGNKGAASEPGAEAEAQVPPWSELELLEIAPDPLHTFVLRRSDGQLLMAAGGDLEGDVRAFGRAIAKAVALAAIVLAPGTMCENFFHAGARSILVWPSQRAPALLVVIVMKRSNASCALTAQRLRLRGW